MIKLSMHPDIRKDLEIVLEGKRPLSYFVRIWGTEIADEVFADYLCKGYQYTLFEDRYGVSPFYAYGGLMHDVKTGTDKYYKELCTKSKVIL